MRRVLTCVLMTSFVACPGRTEPEPPSTETETSATTETVPPTSSELPCDEDEDGDGWCPPEDCDDTTIWVNPSWAENPDDGIDNNCDGRIDEEFSRVLVLQWDLSAGASSVVHVDPLGDLKGTYGAGVFAAPSTATLDHDLRAFVAWDNGNQTLWRYDANGAMSPIGTIDEEYEWPDADGEPDPPPIIGDVAAHPDGYYLVAAGDRLLRFNTDGTLSTVAQWACVEADESHEFCATGLAVDRVWGTVMLFGYFGGIARWTPTGGLEIIQSSNPEEPGPRILQTQFKPFDTWYSLAIYLDEEEEKMNYGIFRYNRSTRQMVLLGKWANPDFQPNSFSIEEATGDFYFAVNSPRGARGAWHNQIWRMAASGQTMAQLYATAPDSDDNYFVAAAVHYNHKAPTP